MKKIFSKIFKYSNYSKYIHQILYNSKFLKKYSNMHSICLFYFIEPILQDILSQHIGFGFLKHSNKMFGSVWVPIYHLRFSVLNRIFSIRFRLQVNISIISKYSVTDSINSLNEKVKIMYETIKCVCCRPEK